MKTEESSLDLSGCRTLIADDKTFIRNLLQGMIRRLGVPQVIHAENGYQAIQKLKRDKSMSLILADWKMEPVNGLELLKMVRMGAVGSLPRDTPFILITAHAEEWLILLARMLDVSGLLVKPVAQDKLEQMIATAIDHPPDLRDPAEYDTVETPALSPLARLPKKKRIPPWVLMSQSPTSPITKSESEIEAMKDDAGPVKNKADLTIKNRKKAKIEDISAGSLLAQDIVRENGNLVLAMGTPLNDNTIKRLKALAAQHAMSDTIWVGDEG